MRIASMPPNFNPIREILTRYFFLRIANGIVERDTDAVWDYLPYADPGYYDSLQQECAPLLKREFEPVAKLFDGHPEMWKPGVENKLEGLVEGYADLIIYDDSRKLTKWFQQNFLPYNESTLPSKAIWSVENARIFEKVMRLSSWKDLERVWRDSAREREERGEDGDRYANSRVASETNPFAKIRVRNIADTMVDRFLIPPTSGMNPKSVPPRFMIRDLFEGFVKEINFALNHMPRKLKEAVESPDFLLPGVELRVEDLETAVIDAMSSKPATLGNWMDKNISPKYKNIEAEIRSWLRSLEHNMGRNHYWLEIESLWDEEEQEYNRRMEPRYDLHRGASVVTAARPNRYHPFKHLYVERISSGIADAMIAEVNKKHPGLEPEPPQNLYFEVVKAFTPIIAHTIELASAHLEKIPRDKKDKGIFSEYFLWRDGIERTISDLQNAIIALVGQRDDGPIYRWATTALMSQEYVPKITKFIKVLDSDSLYDTLQDTIAWSKMIRLWKQGTGDEKMRYSNHVAGQQNAGKGVKIDPREIEIQSTYISGYDDLRDLISDYDAGRVKNQNASSLLYLSVAGVALEGRILVPPNLSKDMLSQFTKNVDGGSDELLETGKHLDEDSIKVDHYYGQYPDESSADYYDISPGDIELDYASADEDDILEYAGEIKNFKALTAQITKKIPSWATGKVSSPSGLYLTGDCEISYDMGDEYICRFPQKFLNEDDETAYVYIDIAVNPGKEKTKYCVEVSAADLQALQKKNKVASSPLRTMPDYGDEAERVKQKSINAYRKASIAQPPYFATVDEDVLAAAKRVYETSWGSVIADAKLERELKEFLAGPKMQQLWRVLYRNLPEVSTIYGDRLFQKQVLMYVFTNLFGKRRINLGAVLGTMDSPEGVEFVDFLDTKVNSAVRAFFRMID